MKSPLDAYYPDKNPLDFCACLHQRHGHLVGDDGRPYCVECREAGLRALAFPWHPFHLTWPEQPMAQMPIDIAVYDPPHGWDRPEPACQ